MYNTLFILYLITLIYNYFYLLFNVRIGYGSEFKLPKQRAIFEQFNITAHECVCKRGGLFGIPG